MLKLLGLLLTAAGAAGVGFSAAAGLSRRVRTLRDLLGALELMEREIAFQLTPMDELFARLAQRTPEPAGAFFARCRRGLSSLGERSLSQIWRQALTEVSLGLDAQTLDTLAGLGDLLGRYDGEGQKEALEQARLQLCQDLRRAEEDQAQRGHMYRMLGLTAGAFLVIVLL